MKKVASARSPVALVVALAIQPLLVTAYRGAVPQSPTPPPELSALIVAGRLDGRAVAWCAVDVTAARRGGYAAALTSASEGGRYHVLAEHAKPALLATYAGKPDLSCYTRREAEKLDASIRDSEGIHGSVTPRWDTTVICGFVEDTMAVCWQFSPDEGAFVRVGRWTT